jgi:hypothetical protein
MLRADLLYRNHARFKRDSLLASRGREPELDASIRRLASGKRASCLPQRYPGAFFRLPISC